MAKNAVTDWSATDGLNTDVGGTNIAEGCAPGGINDAIRKVMAQIAGFITNAVFGGVTINGSTPTLSLNGGGGSNDGTILLYTGGTLKGTLRSSSAGALLASDAHAFKNLSEGITYLGLGANVAAFGTAGTFGGAMSSAGAIRATGTSWTNVSQGAAVELSHTGSSGSGSVAAVDRSTGLYQPLNLQGANVSLQPQGGGVYSGGNHVIQGVGVLGGSALGGVNGQLRFDRADGTANVLNISLAAGNTFLFNDSDGAGTYSFRLNNAERFAVTNALVSSPVPIFSATNVRAGLASVGRGAVQIVQGDASNTGYLEFLNTTGSSTGYVQQAIGGDINYVTNSAGHVFSGNYLNVRKSSTGGLSLTVGTASLTGRMVMTDAAGNPSASIGGQAIGQATLHSNTSGHFFNSYVSATGLVEGTTPGDGTTGGLRTRAIPSGPAIVQFTTNDVSLELASIIAEPSSGRLIFVVGLTPVLSIDGAGNVRMKGSLFENATP